MLVFGGVNQVHPLITGSFCVDDPADFVSEYKDEKKPINHSQRGVYNGNVDEAFEHSNESICLNCTLVN